MNQDQLNTLTFKAFNEIEADAIIVLYNNEKGVKVIPFWEYAYEFKTEQQMRFSLENDLVSSIIEFADLSSGESIGTYAMEWTATEVLIINKE